MSRLPAPAGVTLIATGLTKSHGGLTVLDSVSLTVSSGTRLGVVGPNGAGKTTLLRILAGLTQPDGGSVEKAPPDLQVGYLPQEKTVPGNETPGAFLARRVGVAAAQSDLERTAEALATGEPGADDAYAAALHRYLVLGGADFDARAAAVCDDLDLAPARLELPMDTLSGGQRARAGLASILGSGKTTLLRALIGDVSLTRGQRYLGPSVVIGRIDQERRQLFLGAEPLLDAFRRASGLAAEPARSLLAKFGLGPQHVNRAPATLSPGERTRALLALLAARGVNCLILDEPTNHLDLPAIEQLEQALESGQTRPHRRTRSVTVRLCFARVARRPHNRGTEDVTILKGHLPQEEANPHRSESRRRPIRRRP